MASKRQRKKNTKKQQIKFITQKTKITAKQAERYTYRELNEIIAQETKKEQRNAKRREQYREKKKLIDKLGLKGVSPSSSQKAIDKSISIQQREEAKEKRRAYRQDLKARKKAMLMQGAGLLEEELPKGWQKMSLKEIQALYPENRKDRVYNTGDIWLYIGWGDRSGNQSAGQVFGDSWYRGRKTEDLRGDIAETIKARGIDKSGGKAGDTRIYYGSKEDTQTFMEYCENSGYQTIFFGNEFTEHALLSYTAAALDSSPESDREYIFKKMNGFFNYAGLQELKLEK